MNFFSSSFVSPFSSIRMGFLSSLSSFYSWNVSHQADSLLVKRSRKLSRRERSSCSLTNRVVSFFFFFTAPWDHPFFLFSFLSEPSPPASPVFYFWTFKPNSLLESGFGPTLINPPSPPRRLRQLPLLNGRSLTENQKLEVQHRGDSRLFRSIARTFFQNLHNTLPG